MDIREQMFAEACRTFVGSVARSFCVAAYGWLAIYRKVPAECFEHLHLVSFPYERPFSSSRHAAASIRSSRKLWRFCISYNPYPRFPSRILRPIIFIFTHHRNHFMKMTENVATINNMLKTTEKFSSFCASDLSFLHPPAHLSQKQKTATPSISAPHDRSLCSTNNT